MSLSCCSYTFPHGSREGRDEGLGRTPPLCGGRNRGVPRAGRVWGRAGWCRSPREGTGPSEALYREAGAMPVPWAWPPGLCQAGRAAARLWEQNPGSDPERQLLPCSASLEHRGGGRSRGCGGACDGAGSGSVSSTHWPLCSANSGAAGQAQARGTLGTPLPGNLEFR